MAIVLYGATGYTGRLVTDELARRGLDFVLGGRSREKLERLAAERAPGAEIRTATIDDPASLRALLEGCEVLINCAGPFTKAGEPVVRAAAETGTHYVDSTGEQPFMKMVYDRLDAEAQRSGAALVPALGFDYTPGDCIAHLAARGHEPLEEIVIAYAVSGFAPSRGTMKSTLDILKGGDVVYRDGDWRPAPRSPVRANFEFPAPVGRQAMIGYPSGEIITVPRHVETRKVTSLISASAFVPHPSLAPALGVGMPALAMALRTPLRDSLEYALQYLPEGPDEEQRKGARFTIAVLARGADGSVGRAHATGSDVYRLTAVALVHGAELMATDGYDRAGALTPASAYDPEAFLNYLTDHGVAWDVDREPVAA